MEDISEKINSILSDPQAMDMIQAIAGSLGNASEGEPLQQSQQPQRENGQQSDQNNQNNQSAQIDASQIASIMGALNAASNAASNQAASDKSNGELIQADGIMQALLKIMPLLNQLKYDDERIKLLHALRPLVSEERRERVDYAEKLIRLMTLLSQAGGF